MLRVKIDPIKILLQENLQPDNLNYPFLAPRSTRDTKSTPKAAALILPTQCQYIQHTIVSISQIRRRPKRRPRRTT